MIAVGQLQYLVMSSEATQMIAVPTGQNQNTSHTPSHTLSGIWLLIHVGIKVNPCQ